MMANREIILPHLQKPLPPKGYKQSLTLCSSLSSQLELLLCSKHRLYGTKPFIDVSFFFPLLFLSPLCCFVNADLSLATSKNGFFPSFTPLSLSLVFEPVNDSSFCISEPF
ncbi:hypothetical protein HanRHA438_Chr16g0788831 [Helianthus annuus]|nr:hypothetical protein HanRHA438_Chr16g0788831 [Helianthus annuus]